MRARTPAMRAFGALIETSPAFVCARRTREAAYSAVRAPRIRFSTSAAPTELSEEATAAAAAAYFGGCLLHCTRPNGGFTTN